MNSSFKGIAAALGTVALIGSATARPFADPRSDKSDIFDADQAFSAQPPDPACRASVLVSTGGAMPRSPSTLAVRWTGFSNFELVYKRKVILLDTYFDRGSNYPPLGFAAADVKKADLILIGHGHFDHMSDAASVGLRTGAPIVAAPVTVEKLKSQSVPDSQIRTVTGKGGEKLQFDGFTVEPILARHGQPDRNITKTIDTALNSVIPQQTPEQIAEEKTIMDRGTFDPRVINEGTIAYLITLDNGFRIMYRDSGGRVTEYEQAAMQSLSGVDLAIVAVSSEVINANTAKQALEHMRTYKPDVYMPAHHDAGFSGYSPLWRSTEPVFQALKDANPNLITVSRQYREPICFNTDMNISRGKKP